MMPSVAMFPGQGAQFVGMGAALWARFPEVGDIAERVLGYDIQRLCCEDPHGRLNRTEFTQPAVFVVNYLHFLAFSQEVNVAPLFALGHSLGEFSALQAAGVFDLEVGLQIVRRRGELMATVDGTGMAAVVGADARETERVLADVSSEIDIANINTPRQTVIAGPLAALEAAGDRFEEEGFGFIPLKVSGAFHSRYMRRLKTTFRRDLQAFAFRRPAIPVVANLTAKPHCADPAEIINTLTEQMDHPVLWMDSISYVKQQGDFTFVEMGSTGVLGKMIGQVP